jgi:hypothetical protein
MPASLFMGWSRNMAARKNQSKSQSDGSKRSRSLLPPDDFVLYLDENLCNSTAILATLTRIGVRFERHLSPSSRGAPDEAGLPEAGEINSCCSSQTSESAITFWRKPHLIKIRSVNSCSRLEICPTRRWPKPSSGRFRKCGDLRGNSSRRWSLPLLAAATSISADRRFPSKSEPLVAPNNLTIVRCPEHPVQSLG